MYICILCTMGQDYVEGLKVSIPSVGYAMFLTKPDAHWDEVY